MRYTLAALSAAAAWILPGHLAVLAVLAYALLAQVANTAKARSTETRVGSLENGLAATNTTVTAVQATANNALPASGGTVSGSMTVNGTLTVLSAIGVHGNINGSQDCAITGALNAAGSVTAGVSLATNGGHVYFNGGAQVIDGAAAAWLESNHG